jgi:hypothetical protein
MPFYYQSGQEILKGDRVTFHGDPGEIEFVVDKVTGDPAVDWYMQEFGGGVMLKEFKYFEHYFLHETEDAEDLVFVPRG